MLFNSPQYACFFVCAFAGFWLLANRRRLRVLLLLAASYIFYASWNFKYLGLIFISSSLDFLVGRKLARTDRPAVRKALLALSLTFNLGVLCTFKYFNFFVAQASALLNHMGFHVDPFFLNVVLPVGISFYTFQTMSHTIDVYRRRLKPALDYFEYLLYVSFFSQLLAGPIVRASTLLPQIAQTPTLTAQQGGRAVFRIAIGLVKKIAIADFLGAHIVDPVFSNPQMYSSAEALFAVYSYAFQIYVDFSAYSDIAIGSAGLLGFQIPENFNAPYRAADLREFWQRWHISLSTWLRDYLYISLGGSRRNTARTIVNLMVTMLLGGLWHGAALTFIIWGALHGFALAATRIAQRLRRAQSKPTWHGRAVRVFITFHVVCAAWIFFRAPDLESAMSVFAAIGSFTFSTANISWQSAAMLAAAFFTHYVPESWIEKARDLFDAAPAAVQAAILVGAIMAVQAVASTEVAPFIYFQF